MDALNPNYSDVDGVLFNKDQTRLIQYPGGKTGNYTIPISVAFIGRKAFADCYRLTGAYFQGNAPSLSLAVFDGATNAILITTGDDGLAEELWWPSNCFVEPQVRTDDPNFGVRSNQFGFNISGTTNITVVVEASIDLANPTWTPVATYTLVDGSSYFCDPDRTNYSGRFYRLRSP